MITVKRAVAGRTYRASLLPSSVIGPVFTWTRLGMDEEYSVEIDLSTGQKKVFELAWDDAEHDWNDTEVPESSVDLMVVLP